MRIIAGKAHDRSHTHISTEWRGEVLPPPPPSAPRTPYPHPRTPVPNPRDGAPGRGGIRRRRRLPGDAFAARVGRLLLAPHPSGPTGPQGASGPDDAIALLPAALALARVGVGVLLPPRPRRGAGGRLQGGYGGIRIRASHDDARRLPRAPIPWGRVRGRWGRNGHHRRHCGAVLGEEGEDGGERAGGRSGRRRRRRRGRERG